MKASQSFAEIGFYLKHIRDGGMYQEDGYSSVWEMAQTEFGISKPQASKFISICERFSVGGNSPELRPEYTDFSSSKLQEMLYLDEGQLEQLLGITLKIVNPDFEAAVREMERQHGASGVKAAAESLAKKTARSYPEGMTEEAIRRMYIDENRTMKEIAEHFGVKLHNVNDFISRHGLRRTSYNRRGVKQPEPEAETERP